MAIPKPKIETAPSRSALGASSHDIPISCSRSPPEEEGQASEFVVVVGSNDVALDVFELSALLFSCSGHQSLRGRSPDLQISSDLSGSLLESEELFANWSANIFRGYTRHARPLPAAALNGARQSKAEHNNEREMMDLILC